MDLYEYAVHSNLVMCLEWIWFLYSPLFFNMMQFQYEIHDLITLDAMNIRCISMLEYLSLDGIEWEIQYLSLMSLNCWPLWNFIVNVYSWLEMSLNDFKWNLIFELDVPKLVPFMQFHCEFLFMMKWNICPLMTSNEIQYLSLMSLKLWPLCNFDVHANS